MVRVSVGSISLLAVACGPHAGDAVGAGSGGADGGMEPPPMWRGCDEAFASLRPIAAPPATDSIGYVELGEALPVYRISTPQESAESLANRALAVACVIMDEDVHGTMALLDWAEQSIADDDATIEEPLFVPPLDASYTHTDRAPTLTVAGDPARGAEPLTHGGAAYAIMLETLDALGEAGITGDRDYQYGFIGEIWFDRSSDEPRLDAYIASFLPTLAGVTLAGSKAELLVRPDGRVTSIELSLVEVEAAGTTTAALSEDAVDARYRALAAAKYPDAEVVQPGSGGTVYLVPKRHEPAEVEAVWSASFFAEFDSGDVGPTERYTLSLTDPDAPLVLYE